MGKQYREFYTTYKDKLYSYLLYRCGDRDLAQDIMQESFVRHLQRYGQTAAASPGLLFTIARNALVDWQRRKWKFPLGEAEELKTGYDEEDRCIAREETSKIHCALKQLPELEREMLVLAVNGVSYEEIAQMHGLSRANVKVKVHRARAQLRQVLG
jgi:RNA polymerase sigma-70 factor, ECF subfamily